MCREASIHEEFLDRQPHAPAEAASPAASAMIDSGLPATAQPEVIRRQAIGHQQGGRLNEAVAGFRRLIELSPADPEALSLLGEALLLQGDPQGAQHCFQQQLSLQADSLRGLLNLARALQHSGDPDAALDCLLHALLLHPHSADAHTAMGVALRARGDTEAALSCLLEALRLRPDNPQILLELGRVQADRGAFDLAASSFEAAVRVGPDLVDAWGNLGAARHVLGDLEGSAQASEQALRLQPDHANARSNLALVQLLRGEYALGLENFEHRFRTAVGAGLLCAQPPCPRWDGSPLQAHSQLLLVSEQGLGDTVQFMRYLPTLRAAGVAVRLCAPEPLHGLIRHASLDDSPLTPEQASKWNEGVWLPLLSLPRHLGASPRHPLESDPYIPLPSTRVLHWQSRLADAPRPIIGLNWQGNPRQETTSLRGRSLLLERFATVAECVGGSLLALQKGPGAEQRQDCTFADSFVACQDEVDGAWDFRDAVALISLCDLVITSDSCVAHLAGAMGHPTWLLLARVPDWRWGLEGDHTGWYPSLRLFRQRQSGDWHELMQRVAETLPAYLEGRSGDARQSVSGVLPK